ncbi:MAG: PEP-CTERM sorting domain-containing protein [Phycisphaerae bacterium]|nr:PEP-CTERM sorting domain-containing protein [Phycisphaerae bacterium]
MRNIAVLLVLVLFMMVPCVTASITLLDVEGFNSYTVQPYPRVLSGQYGWASTGTSLVILDASGDSSPFKDPYGDLPGIGVTFWDVKSNYYTLTGTDENDQYQVEFTLYLSPYGTNTFGFRGVEVLDGGTLSYPFELIVSDVGDSSGNYTVQALAADGSVAFDTGSVFAPNSLNRLDVVINADFSKDVYTVGLTQWTPATWESGTPVQTWTSNSISLKDSPDVALERIELFSTNSGSPWTLLDDLKVSVVPEPATLLLLVLGGLFYRRK